MYIYFSVRKQMNNIVTVHWPIGRVFAERPGFNPRSRHTKDF